MKFLIILSLIMGNHALSGANTNNFNLFCAALGKIESSNNPQAYNKKENAIGIYQIRSLYFEDAKKFDKSLTKYTHKDCFNEIISKQVVKAYMRRYESKALQNNNLEILARAHNGGCNWRKHKNATNNYWIKFQRYIK